MLEIHNRHMHRGSRLDDLPGLPCGFFERRSHAFVTSDDFGKSPFQRRYIKRPLQLVSGDHGVDRAAAQLLHKPEALLRKRKRQRLSAGHRLDRRNPGLRLIPI